MFEGSDVCWGRSCIVLLLLLLYCCGGEEIPVLLRLRGGRFPERPKNDVDLAAVTDGRELGGENVPIGGAGACELEDVDAFQPTAGGIKVFSAFTGPGLVCVLVIG